LLWLLKITCHGFTREAEKVCHKRETEGEYKRGISRILAAVVGERKKKEQARE
jgi:hypothetical protein